MIIKKFSGKNEEEAVAAAKKELGEGVVIMNVRNIKKKGFFSIFSTKQVEVTGALEEENDKFVRREAVTKSVESDVVPLKTRVGMNKQNSDTDSIEKKLDSLQILLESQMRKAEEEKNTSETSELSGDAGDKEKGKSDEGIEKSPESTEQEKFLRLLYNTMLENEVDEKIANQILEDVDVTKKTNMPIDYILTNVYQKMILKFGKSEGITPAENGPKIVMFIGPTGVGKTTTIAKLASILSMDEKKKVVLLTADTFRIAAAEQLRTYANILEVPFRIIYTEEELATAISDFNDYDYIFVDTAGHSHQNNEQIQKMKELLESINDTADYQAFLVVSATTKYHDLIKISEKYRGIVDFQLIFTKLDETECLGNLLNIKMCTGAPIAYTAYGQNVPDDIDIFNPQKTVKQLLGGKS